MTSAMAVKDQQESDSNASFVLDIIIFSVWIHPFRSKFMKWELGFLKWECVLTVDSPLIIDMEMQVSRKNSIECQN